jgi:hypothetical protein
MAATRSGRCASPLRAVNGSVVVLRIDGTQAAISQNGILVYSHKP